MSALSSKLSQAGILVALADTAELFRASEGDAVYATIEVNGHHETWPVRSTGFRRWLVGQFYELERKPPNAQALADALGVIEARGQYEGGDHAVCVRVSGHDGRIYLDLANEKWQAVEVTPDGWDVICRPPVKFRRPRGMLVLPCPERSGTVDELRGFVNVGTDDQWVNLVAWLVAALRPTGPYPVLTFHGEQGTAKSTTAEVARSLIDPNAALLRAEPQDVRDVMIAASNGWCIALDNVSHLPPWLSDCLCRLATGGGFSTRELYTNADETIFAAQRPVLLNGIDEIITRSDLLDRAVILDLPRIDDRRRRPHADFWRDFHAARPRILGALLDTVANALKRLPTVRVNELPRMADFAVWATAAEPSLGWESGQFLRAYTGNRRDANELALDASIIAGPVRALALGDGWTGTATGLLDKLNGAVDETVRRDRHWPKNGRALSSALRRVAPNFRAIGVEVVLDSPERRHREPGTGRRLITLREAGHSSVTTVTDAGCDDRDGCDGPDPVPF